MQEQSLLYPRASVIRSVTSLDGFWKFQFDPENKGEKEGWVKKLPSPISMPVPASFSDFFTDKDSREYSGDFWYETDFFIPSEWKGRAIAVRFAGAAHRAVVYVNGREITSHEGGFTPFNADVSDTVNFGGPNTLAVKLNNELSEASIPVGVTGKLQNGKRIAKPYFDFFNYSGLQRPVTLLALPKEHITNFTVCHELKDGDAAVHYTVETSDKTTGSSVVSLTIFDENGKQAASAEGENGVNYHTECTALERA